MTEVLHVACAATGDHVAHSAAMLHSVATWRGPLELHVHYLHGPDLASGARDRLRRLADRSGARLQLVEVPRAATAQLPRIDRIPAMMWHRVLLPDLLPDHDRVLYLDTDIVVVDELAPLWATELQGAGLGAVTNVLVEPEHRAHIARLGLTADRYLNSGVLLMDLERLRRTDAAARVTAFGRAADGLLFPEQDALSVVLAGEWLPLHPRWNAMNAVMDYPEAAEVFDGPTLAEARAAPAIRHFEGPGPNKPWHYRCARPQREVYREHRRQTPWPRHRPEGRTPRAVLGRLRRALHARRA